MIIFECLKTFTNTLRHLFIYFLLCTGTFLMLRGILAYSAFKSDTGFLAFKQDYLHITVWKVAFYTHVFSSIFTLIAGFTQFTGQIGPLHRLVGRLYAWNILVINFPAGMIMAIYANGYLPSKLAFIILDSLWFWFTLKAVIEIKRGNVAAHKRYMIRSYALTCSALTLRTWKLILSNTFAIDPVTLYMIDAWLGFVPNLLLAEWLIRRKKKNCYRPKLRLNR